MKTIGDLIASVYRYNTNSAVSSVPVANESEYLLWAEDAVNDVSPDYEMDSTFTDPVDIDDEIDNLNEFALLKAKMIDIMAGAEEGGHLADGAGISIRGGMDSISTEGVAVAFRDKSKRAGSKYEKVLAEVTIKGHTGLVLDLYDIEQTDIVKVN